MLLAKSRPKLWKKQGQAESLLSLLRGVLGSEDLGVQVPVAVRPRWLSRSLARPLVTVPSAEPGVQPLWPLGCCRRVVLQAGPQGPARETGLGIKGRSPDSLHRLNGRCPFHRLVEWEGAEASSLLT